MNAHADRAASSLVLVLRFLSPRRDMKAPGYVDMAASSLALFLVRATTSSYEGNTGELGAEGLFALPSRGLGGPRPQGGVIHRQGDHTAPGLPFLCVPSPSSMTIVFLVLALGTLSFLMITVVFLADLISVWSCRHLHCFHVAPWLPFLEVPSSPSSMTIVFLGVDTSCHWH